MDMFLPLFLRKCSRRLHADALCYSLLAPLMHRRVDTEQDAADRACTQLLGLWPDQGRSCLHANETIRTDMADLQIIIPAYNAERYIAECLRSVTGRQSRYRVIITVINDGSTDGTRRILNDFAHTPGLSVINQPNGGFSRARNAGLSRLHAPYIMFLDADDRLAPGAIDTLMDKAIATGADITEGGYERFRDGEPPFFRFAHTDSTTDDWTVLYSYPWGKVFRAQLFADVHFPEDYWFEDTLLPYIIFPQARRVATVDTVVYHYRDNSEGISRSSVGRPRCLDALWVTRRLLDDCHTLGIPHDNRLYNTVLADIATNFSRIRSLGSPQTDRDLFVVTARLLHRHFPSPPCPAPHLRPLEQALRTSDYHAYYLWCLFHSF
ncbi:MAG: glycosyltransferase family 2 protein [Clostridium sp.]|nr:glycosyltransferase family 2 protein [Clostridium sp.]